MNMFTKATLELIAGKFGITGPSGSGKTTAALNFTRGLVGPNGKIALLDTENRSASLYCALTNFDVLNMQPPYQVKKFTDAIQMAVDNKYDALIIDSGSAEWQELLAEKEAMDSRGGNSFASWGAIGKKHEDFLKAIRNAPIHLVVCLRAKQEHVQDKDANGRTTIRKVGMAAIQREGMEYELTTVFDIAMDHNAKASKDRTGLFDGRLEPITRKTGEEVAAWLAGGNVPVPNPEPEPTFQERAPQISEKETQQQLGQMVQDRAAQVETVIQEATDFVDAITPLPRITMSQWEDLNELQTAAHIDGRQLRPYCVKKGWLPANAEGLDRLSPEGFKPLQLNMGAEKSRAFKAWLESNFPLPVTPTKTKKSKAA